MFDDVCEGGRRFVAFKRANLFPAGGQANQIIIDTTKKGPAISWKSKGEVFFFQFGEQEGIDRRLDSRLSLHFWQIRPANGLVRPVAPCVFKRLSGSSFAGAENRQEEPTRKSRHQRAD